MDAGIPTLAVYDEIHYHTVLVPAMTPASLHTVGLLQGWEAPHPDTASILELGAADGLNMLAVADAYPRSRCVGIDLSVESIRRGEALREAAGIANAELTHGDITAMPAEGEQFDYIVAHGLLSWVPSPVREAALRIVGQRLKPGGVAYFGYDALPASGPKAAIVSYVRPLVERLYQDPMARVDAFVEFVRRLRENQRPGSALAGAMDLILSAADEDKGHFYHDWLGPIYAPLPLDGFVAMAAANGLRFAGDAGRNDRYIGDLSPAGLDVLGSAGDDPVQRAIVLGLLRGVQSFRSDMLVRADAPPPVADPSLRPALYYHFEPQPTEPDAAAADEPPDADPAREAIFEFCRAASPRELTAAEVAAGTGLPFDRVASELFEAARAGALSAEATAPGYTLAAGERPLCSGLVRAMLEQGDSAVTSRLSRVEVGNPMVRRLLQLCDGTRTRADLAAQLSREAGSEIGLAGIDGALAAAAGRRLIIG